ncbi:MAG TPA: FAD-binding protein [Acidimicrobiia bacterium]|nr:FAD-binding protein [Acidimicrobiia bacterium]
MAVDTRDLGEFTAAERQDLPPARHRLAPASPAEMAEVMAAATAVDAVVVPWGGGTHQGLGRRVAPDVVVATTSLDRIVEWQPDDLTVVVEAGVLVDDLERELAGRNQTAALPETAPGATVGGVISAGVSGYRRPRYGPTRDRILQTTLATGDGRLVTAGGRVVKNVSGYDIQRSVFGAHGSLGVITSVCLKLWPRSTTSATVAVDDPVGAWKTMYRPLAVLETESGAAVYVEGPPQQVDIDVARLGGERTEGLAWPQPPRGDVTVAVTVAPADIAAAVERIRHVGPFVAQHGVGRVDVAGAADADWTAIRAWAEERGGRLTVTSAPDTFYDGLDAWGADPPALDVQRRLIAAFDPGRVVNRGRLPGGI